MTMTAKELADKIRMDLGLHSCPPEGGFCWRCEALEKLEPMLSLADKEAKDELWCENLEKLKPGPNVATQTAKDIFCLCHHVKEVHMNGEGDCLADVPGMVCGCEKFSPA